MLEVRVADGAKSIALRRHRLHHDIVGAAVVQSGQDDQGAELDGSCTYEIAGMTPPARLWTLTAYDAAGRLMPNPASRFAYDSRAILRRSDGSFVIAAAGRESAGLAAPRMLL